MVKKTQPHQSVLHTDAGDFLPVRVASLVTNSVTNFSLYVRPNSQKQPVLYREKALPFSEEARARLEDNKVEELYIEASQEEDYRHYVEQNLGTLLTDERVDTEEKSNLAYMATHGLIREVLESPRSTETVQRARVLVLDLVDFLLEDKASLSGLIQAMSFDYYTYTHSVNVFVFSVALAQRIGFKDSDTLRELGDGALLHDVGKSLVDPDLLNFPGIYNAEQLEKMKKHTVFGHTLLTEHGLISASALDVVRHHHEKLGGQGYPDGLDGDTITPFARICAIADVFDALTTTRTYKDAMDSFPALKLMNEEMLQGLDQEYFRIFVAMMGNPEGAD